jgi:hypothetical protein
MPTRDAAAPTAYERIHPLQLVDVAADDIAGDDSSDEFNHAVHDAADAVHGDHGIGIVSVSRLAAGSLAETPWY